MNGMMFVHKLMKHATIHETYEIKKLISGLSKL